MRRLVPYLLLSAAAAAAPVELDNGIIRVGVDPRRGGAVTALVLAKAITFPLIADKGAGVAGSGGLFGPALEAGGISAGVFAMRVAGREKGALTLMASLDEIGPGVKWTRRIRLAAAGSGLTIEDELRNESGRTLAVRLGSDSRQQAEPWRLTDRSWVGSEQGCARLTTSDREPPSPPARARGGRLFWRQIEQYGTGFLYRLEDLPGGGAATAQVLPGAGRAVQVILQSGEVDLPAHGKLTMRATVTVDEGGGAPDQGNAFHPVLARADFAAAGRGGQALLGCATVVSPQAGRVLVVVSSDRELARREMDLEPGKVARLPVAFVPPGPGRLKLNVAVTAAGAEVGWAAAETLIDGDPRNAAWRRYTQRMPEEHYHGSWREIGEQLVRGGQPIGYPTAMPVSIAPEGSPDNGLAFYDKAYPYYADLIRGVAQASGAAPNRVFLRGEDEDSRGGCMDAVYYGPDGPINAFSKERYEGDFHGDGYVKVVPARGYPFHYFEYYGVNSEGLSISGAACCEDENTHRVAAKRLADWNRSGGHSLPAKAGLWMVFATCRNVDEALRLITDRAAPLVFTGNMFLVDRAGNAARLESVGIESRVYRHRPEDGGLFVAGNFLHPRDDGLFQIGRWSWAANSMLREQFLRRFVGARQGRLGLPDVMAVMQTHEAGGMCQHHHDDSARLYTCCSFIAVPRTSELWLAEGPPCEVGYVRYTLSP